LEFEMSKVLVTGATGFVAGHCIADLLAHGHSVRGTVRSLADPGRVAHLRALDGDLDLVEADLSGDDGWAAAVDGVDAVFHVASPTVGGSLRDAEAMVRPAVDGTLRVLRAAAAAGVRRVVLTSSVAAINSGHARGDHRLRTEADWSDVDNCHPYPKSKTLAERAAWEFADQHPELEVVAINAGLVLGPLQHDAGGPSLEVVSRLLNREMPAVPRLGFAPGAVRDLATAHRLALENPAAAGNRYVCAGESIWMTDIAGLLAEEYNPRGFRVPTGTLPYWAMWMFARFDHPLRQMLEFADRPENVSAAKADRELGWQTRPVRETLVDTANSLIERGLTKRAVSSARPADRHPRPAPRS
jgi:nucleoside-diphosphate-sugar epimerase